MNESLIITVDIDLQDKNVFISEENSSGAKYDYTNIDNLVDKLKLYLENYYSDVIK